jgi:hypothetical protein
VIPDEEEGKKHERHSGHGRRHAIRH